MPVLQQTEPHTSAFGQHAPLTHVSPEEQTFPQLPQLLGSLWVFAQVSPQQAPEQQSPFPLQVVPMSSQQEPLTQVSLDEHIETQVPVLDWHVWHWLVSQGADRQTEPQTLAFAQQWPPRQV